jgi:acyl carrier protein
MKQLTAEIKSELKKMVYDFFAEECEVDIEELTDDTKISDLDGDSLMTVELIEMEKKKYKLDIQLQAVGKYLLTSPAETLGKIVDMICLVYQYENDIVNLQNS